MFDKLDLRIPFLPDFVRQYNNHLHPDNPAGAVDFRDFDFPIEAKIQYTDREGIKQDIRNYSWESIPSSLSALAVGFFPEGNGTDCWPHVRVKASPAKFIQGHNVFGSEFLREGALQMLASAAMAFPAIWRCLDMQHAEICYLDATYSAQVPSKFHQAQIFRLLRSTAASNRKAQGRAEWLLIGAGSERTRQKVYAKGQELSAELKRSMRTGARDQVKVLSHPDVQRLAEHALRFENTTGKRRLYDLKIPTGFYDFLKFEQDYHSQHGEPLCRFLWRDGFGPMLAQLEGHTMKNVDDDKVRERIFSHFTTYTDTGKPVVRRANAIWRTYHAIKTEGYEWCLKHSKATTLRNVQMLEQIGLSRAFLKSLDPVRPNENVVPIVSLINIDFSNQRPANWTEPKAGFDDPRRLLKLVS